MRKYLIGEAEDNPLYEFRFVDNIEKKDLLRCKDFDRFVIFNIIDGTKFDLEKNEWIPIKQTEKYAPWDEGKT